MKITFLSNLLPFHNKALAPNTFLSMAKIGRISDLKQGVPAQALIQGVVDDTVTVPEELFIFNSPETSDTDIWWDRQKKLFRVLQRNSFPDIEFNLTQDLRITACTFIWDTYRANVKTKCLSKLSIPQLASLSKDLPHVKYQFMLDNCDLNHATRQTLIRSLKDSK